MAYKIAVLASTNGTDLQAIIDEMKAGLMPGIELTTVMSNKECYAIERAKEQGYATFVYPQKNRDELMLAKLQELGVDLVVLIGYMRILSSAFVSAFEGRILNVHPSLLPAFAGGMDTNVHEEVLAAGVKETGCTIHIVTNELDAGPIVFQEACSVDPGDTADTLKAKVQAIEKRAYPEVIRQFATKPRHI